MHPWKSKRARYDVTLHWIYDEDIAQNDNSHHWSAKNLSTISLAMAFLLGTTH